MRASASTSSLSASTRPSALGLDERLCERVGAAALADEVDEVREPPLHD
jgi:hypothetical protein